MESEGKKLRVLLIQPPATGGVRSLLPQVDDGGEGIGFKPPIGLLYVATMLKKRSRHEVSILDCQAERLTVEESARRVVDWGPDVVGITAWTEWWYPTYRLGRLIKEELPGAHLCYGGPHLGIYPEETLSIAHVDSVVAGDGEVPFARLCEMVARGRLDNSQPGLHLKGFGVKAGDDLFYIEKDLDSLPNPDRTILSLKNYTSVLGKSGFITTMVTSRGCPYKCIYCKLNFQKTICRSAGSVLEEFAEIRALGIKEVEIYDDTFTWSKKRVVEICEGLVAAKNKVRWAIRDRVNAAEPELLDLMKKAGCARIHYGIESGDDGILKLIKKNITLEQARRAVSAAKKRGFTVLAYFMLGNKGETVELIRKTIEFSLELDPDYAEFSITIPYPGTEMYGEALERGIISHDYWRGYALEPVEDFVPPELYEERVKFAELAVLRDEAIRRFYFRPSYVLKELLKTRSFSEIVRKGKMAYHLLLSLIAWKKKQG